MRAYEIEDDFGTVEAAEGLLRQAVQACSASERLWLMLIQLKYLKEKDSEGARRVVEEAMAANKQNQEFISSEKIWIAAYQVVSGGEGDAKIEWEAHEIDRAREILRRARTNCSSARVWVKSALLEWEEGRTAEELALLREGIQKFSNADKLHMMLGQLHEEQNQVEEARAAYR